MFHWIGSSIGFNNIKKIVRIDTVDEEFCSFSFQTSSHEYDISALRPSSENMAGSLAGVIKNRILSTGSDDIGGGPYSFITWVDILQDIIRYELIPY